MAYDQKNINTNRASLQDTVYVEGILERIIFSNEENGFCVVRIETEEGKNFVIATGNFLGIGEGENIRLLGRWASHPKYGRQFEVSSYQLITPHTIIGIERYLGSGLIRGIGPVMAKRIVAQFGQEALVIIEETPERLCEVEGIGKHRLEMITTAWQQQKNIRSVMLFLHEHGVSTAYAIKIYKQYQDAAIALIKENPYRLAEDIMGIGFKIADSIAKKFGIAQDSPLRAQAGILYFLNTLSEEGHVCYPQKELIIFVTEQLESSLEVVEQAVETLVALGSVIRDVSSSLPYLYLDYLWASEQMSVQKLKAMLCGWIKPMPIRIDQAIQWVENTMNITFSLSQKEAISKIIQEKIVIVTGGPGTGKTTLIRGVVQIMQHLKQRILLCAPTGRAAKRMTEAAGIPAKTIHRMLEFNPHTRTFQRTKENLLEVDVLIIDEVSMVDTPLFASVLAALPEDARLILVGDKDQLPSVGPGNVLGDLIDSDRICVVSLSQIFRQEQGSQIILNAHAVNSGQFPDLTGRDFFFFEQDNPEEVLTIIKHIIVDSLPRRFGIRSLEEVQVFSPMNKGPLGVHNLNQELQMLVNPTGHSMVKGNKILRVNDKVMQIRNNYDLDVFNGDLGKIVKIDLEEHKVHVQFEEKVVSYDEADVDDLVLGYACSVHKAQGSEYSVVIMPVHTQHYVMLKRNLLYTAITRGKKLVILVGMRNAIWTAVRNNQLKKRYTRLAEKLKT